MSSNRSNRHLYTSHSLDYQSNNNHQEKDDDNLSLTNLYFEAANGLNYLSSNLNTFLTHRQTSNRRLRNSIIKYKDSNENGLIINGSLFDGQLFQPAHSSYIIDYSNKPQDLNQFLENHNSSSTYSQLDAHLYKLVFIVTLSDWNVDKEILLEYYPYEDKNVDILDEITHYKGFCFPELNPLQKNGGQLLNDQLTYIFTRILSDGQVEYGYCRRIMKDSNQITKYPIVICIVSIYSYFKLYDAILNELTSVYISDERECNSLMQAFYSKPLPVPTVNSLGITCRLNDHRLFFYVCPRDNRLTHDYFSTLISCLSSSQIIHLLESMLRSKRILLFSSYPSKLTKCCLALSFLLYPFIWPYSFVSLMPSSWLHDLLDAPCPYIYGCLYETIEQIPLTIDNDIIRVDLDLNTISSTNDTSHLFPLHLRQILENSLEYLRKFRLKKLNSTLINLAVSEACLYVFTELFYRLPDFFKREKLAIKTNEHFSICSDYFKNHDSGIDLQSFVLSDLQQVIGNTEHQQEVKRLGYEFHSEEFLHIQPISSYIFFLKEFINGMIFLKFLDDYQRNEDNKNDIFSLFSQRINERRQMTFDELSINPFIRFRQTVDLLEHQMKQGNSSFSRILKKIFEQT